MKAQIIVLAGPTAVGKTKLSVNLAKKINAEIISCDSMQIYKHMDIGSAKVTKYEMDSVVHHMIDIVEPYEEYSVAEYKEACEKLIEGIHKKGKRILFTGGTGLYIDSIIKNLEFTQSAKDDELRKELENIATTQGNEALHSILNELDPQSADKTHKNNVKRVIRAIEVTKLTGKKFSSYEKKEKLNELYDIHYYFLNTDREKLYSRINLRVDKMIENGLIEEVKKLKEMGLKRESQSMQGIGYKEVFEYLSGKLSLDEMTELIKKNSRHYAKRQLTWFRNDEFAKEISKDKLSDEEIISMIVNDLNN